MALDFAEKCFLIIAAGWLTQQSKLLRHGWILALRTYSCFSSGRWRPGRSGPGLFEIWGQGEEWVRASECKMCTAWMRNSPGSLLPAGSKTQQEWGLGRSLCWPRGIGRVTVFQALCLRVLRGFKINRIDAYTLRAFMRTGAMLEQP